MKREDSSVYRTPACKMFFIAPCRHILVGTLSEGQERSEGGITEEPDDELG